jgi:Xaa-Pro aminopeptidase
LRPNPPQAGRLALLQARLADEGVDALLVSRPENRRYLSGFQADDAALSESSGHLLVTAEKAFLLTDFRYQEEAAEEAPGFEVRVYPKGLADLLAEILPGEGIKRLGFESDYLVHDAVIRLTRALDGIEALPTLEIVSDLRAVKDDQEVEAIEASLAVIEEVVDGLMARLEPGMTEREAAWWVAESLWKRGADEAFETIIASGPNAAKPHARPSDRRLKEGETIIIDAGARLDGYCSDITRTAWLGPPSEKFKQVYAIVRRAQLAAIEGIRAGLAANRADALAREVIEAAGFGQAFGHSLGHGVGLAAHEAPSLSSLKATPLTAGNITTIEPGIYLPGWGGVRLEVMSLVTEDGCRVLGGLERFYNF